MPPVAALSVLAPARRRSGTAGGAQEMITHRCLKIRKLVLTLAFFWVPLNAGDPAAGSRASALSVLADPPAGTFYTGVFPGGQNGMGSDVTEDEVRTYEERVGKRPTWVYFCDNWYEGRAFPDATASWIRANGSIPYIRLMLLSDPSIPLPDPVFNLTNILSGKLDPDLRRWMQGARQFGSPLLAEYGVEVNGWWFPWNGLWNQQHGSHRAAVAMFRGAYRHIIQIARNEGASNIRWVFHVDPWDEPVRPWNRFENYYPGDEWIDWVGASVYGRQLPRDDHTISFRFQMDWVYRRLTKLANKPVIVCEFGTIKDPGQAAWAKAALTDLLRGRWPRIIGFSWWNAAFYNDSTTGRQSNMRVQDNPALQAVFRRDVGQRGNVLGALAVAAASHPISQARAQDSRHP